MSVVLSASAADRGHEGVALRQCRAVPSREHKVELHATLLDQLLIPEKLLAKLKRKRYPPFFASLPVNGKQEIFEIHIAHSSFSASSMHIPVSRIARTRT